jgi:hypothetical protein
MFKFQTPKSKVKNQGGTRESGQINWGVLTTADKMAHKSALIPAGSSAFAEATADRMADKTARPAGEKGNGSTDAGAGRVAQVKIFAFGSGKRPDGLWGYNAALCRDAATRYFDVLRGCYGATGRGEGEWFGRFWCWQRFQWLPSQGFNGLTRLD